MKILAPTFVVAAALGCAAPLRAQAGPGDPEIGLRQLAQELFLAETVYPQERGEVQLTAYGRTADGARGRLLAEYGLTDRLQLSLATPSTGAGDSEDEVWEPGVLYALIPDDRPVAVSIELEASLRDGEAPRWEPAVIAAHRFGRVQVHGSVRAELADPAEDVSGALAALLDAGRLTPTVEAVWASGEDDHVVPGLFIHLLHDVEAGVGVPLCIHCDGSPPREVRAMLTVEF